MSEQTYWNGYPAPARRVRVIVGKSLRPTWWCAGLEGQQREAVEVHGDGEAFYLDNEDGSGWGKITRGRGSPAFGHAELPVARVIASVDTRPEGGDPAQTGAPNTSGAVPEGQTPSPSPHSPGE